jgi:asparagine synthase (glutamine-hydrolysing)
MTFLAGIVRHDGRAVPDEWISCLAQAGAGKAELQRLPSANGDAVFLAGEGAARAFQDRVLLCDARLDEREDLVSRLSRDFTLPFDAEDSDIVACGYRHLGEDWLDGLVGDFAVATWTPESRRLTLSSSPLATRALFYVAQDGLFAFASTLRALLALPFVSRDLDDGAVCRLLSFDGSGPADATYYAAARRLPAAHRLTLDRGRLSVEALAWPIATPSVPGLAVRGDAAETARGLLIQAVECRMRTGRAIAVHLSGGLDSSAIACIAARRLKQQGRRLIALCSVLPAGHVGPESDERAFINAVLEQEDNIDPVWVAAPPDCDPFGALPRWFDCLGEPPYSNATHAEELLGEAGRAHGVDVVLSGFGGDFFVSAATPPLPAALLLRGRWGAAADELFRLGRAAGLADWPVVVRRQLLGPLVARFRAARASADMGCAAPALSDLVERREGTRPRSTVPGMAGATAHETMRHILAPGHLERVLPANRQIFLEAFDQDLRFPLLDARLVAFVLSLSEAELGRGGQPRSLMRRATVGILPEMVRLRPDKGPAFDPALAAHSAHARPGLRRWIDAAPPRCWDYVDKQRLLDALEVVEPVGKAGWRGDMFSALLTGGRMARFIEWHMRSGQSA